jgi:hypothetical protein
MKLGRNQLSPCGSGVKVKKCCRVPSTLIGNAGLIVPASVVDDVVNTIATVSDEDLVRRFENLARTQPNLCAFITPLSSSLPQEAAYPATLAGFAIIWMFEKHHQRCLPRVSTAEIHRCVDSNGQSFFDFDDFRDRRGAMSGKHQPFIHKYIADLILDFERSGYDSDGVDLFRLFMMLKTTVDVLHESTTKAVLEETIPALSAAAT